MKLCKLKSGAVLLLCLGLGGRALAQSGGIQPSIKAKLEAFCKACGLSLNFSGGVDAAAIAVRESGPISAENRWLDAFCSANGLIYFHTRTGLQVALAAESRLLMIPAKSADTQAAIDFYEAAGILTPGADAKSIQGGNLLAAVGNTFAMVRGHEAFVTEVKAKLAPGAEAANTPFPAPKKAPAVRPTAPTTPTFAGINPVNPDEMMAPPGTKPTNINLPKNGPEAAKMESARVAIPGSLATAEAAPAAPQEAFLAAMKSGRVGPLRLHFVNARVGDLYQQVPTGDTTIKGALSAPGILGDFLAMVNAKRKTHMKPTAESALTRTAARESPKAEAALDLLKSLSSLRAESSTVMHPGIRGYDREAAHPDVLAQEQDLIRRIAQAKGLDLGDLIDPFPEPPSTLPEFERLSPAGQGRLSLRELLPPAGSQRQRTFLSSQARAERATSDSEESRGRAKS